MLVVRRGHKPLEHLSPEYPASQAHSTTPPAVTEQVPWVPQGLGEHGSVNHSYLYYMYTSLALAISL